MDRPQDEETRIQYLDWQVLYEKEKPFQLFSALPEGDLPNQRTTNLVFKEGEAECIHDVRGKESHFVLDKQGFTFRGHQTQVHDFGRREDVEGIYLPEMEELLRRELKEVDQVYFFDWRIRKNIELTGQTVIDANDKMQYLLPAKHAHIGMTSNLS
ncbi:hypothetical protein P7C71_g480, partial [Lecanoromycetidae sp. Uapishka_2]